MSPRPTIHRDFTIATAGFFTVVKPAARFVRSRLPEPFRDYLGRSPKTPAKPEASTPERKAEIQTDDRELMSRLQIMPPAEQNSHLLRLILLVIVATALSWAALWMLGHP